MMRQKMNLIYDSLLLLQIKLICNLNFLDIRQMSTLTTLCIEKIANTIENAPPMIQEMIINNTSENIKNKALKQTIKEMSILPTLVSSISKSIILARSTFNDNPNFYQIYVTIPFEIVNLAIDIAERNIYELDKTFNILSSVTANTRYRFYQSDNDSLFNEDEQEDEDDQEDEEMYNFQSENETE
jgi:hypothetical protein